MRPPQDHIDREVRALLLDEEWNGFQADHADCWKFWKAWFRPGSFLHDIETRIFTLAAIGFLAFVAFTVYKACDGARVPVKQGTDNAYTPMIGD